jgi:geranylgeranyl diphosphate synthase, type II
MDQVPRWIEQALSQALNRAEARGGPPMLARALRHAVMPGGARVRPKLCMAVAMACSTAPQPGAAPRGAAVESSFATALGAAVAIELLHCASLVHDDLPCFDNAPTRRGQASVHSQFGERIAVLAGDALIVMAFESLVLGAAAKPMRVPDLLLTLTRCVGMPHGIVAGQAWECEASLSLPDYHRAKTGSLFAAATEMGALSAGVPAQPWVALGERLGDAYQLADDIRDVACDEASMGKPAQRDRTLGRPSAVAQWGMVGALARFEGLIRTARDAVPEGHGAKQLRALVQAESERLLPVSVRAVAAAA